MSIPYEERLFSSFDGSTVRAGKLFLPDRFRAIESLFGASDHFSVQGAGVSYPPLSFSDSPSVVNMTQFNRILRYDSDSGVVEVEAGMTLGKLAEFSIPRGWYLKVQPGHPSITIGGCVAVDVHGKNQFQDLNFKEHVLYLRIFHPDKGFIYCDRSENSALFHLTCGGWGLTGIIISVGIKLGFLESHQISTDTLPVSDIFELPQLLLEYSKTEDLLFTWHDFNKTKNWGEGFVKVGRLIKDKPTAEAELTSELKRISIAAPLIAENRGQLHFNFLNRLGTFALNSAYYAKEIRSSGRRSESLMNILFPVIDKTIYYTLFGAKGFHETQVLIPFDAFANVTKELRRSLAKFGVPITLASCKLFKGQPELLRFIGSGIVLAINFPRNTGSAALLNWWDEIVCHHGCTPNISKDSRLPATVIRNTYPQFETFKVKLVEWDAKRVFQTSLSQRLEV
jgi:decaprenylphospho-beta-D-ribofuranose 2-oxidase